MAERNVSDGLGAHSSDFEDTVEKERHARAMTQDLQRLCEDRKRKYEDLEQRHSALEDHEAKSNEHHKTVVSALEKEAQVLNEKTKALQNELATETAKRKAEASNASLSQAECRRLREEKVTLTDELAELRSSRDVEASNASIATAECRRLGEEKAVLENRLAVLTASRDAEASKAILAQDECRRSQEQNLSLQEELTALRANRDVEARNAALAQDGWQKVREENTALRVEIATMRASQNAAAALPTTQRRPEAPEEHTPAQRITEEPEMVAVSLPMKALKGKDSNGNLVCLEIANLGDRLQRELSQLVPEWQAIAKKKWKRKSWDEMTKAIMAAPNQCAPDKVDNTGACLWTLDDRQLFACRKSANNGRYCLRPHNKTLLLLPLPPAARASEDPTQPGYYRLRRTAKINLNSHWQTQKQAPRHLHLIQTPFSFHTDTFPSTHKHINLHSITLATMASAMTDRISNPDDPLTQAKVTQWKLDTRALTLAKVKAHLSRIDLRGGNNKTVINGREAADDMSGRDAQIDEIVEATIADEQKLDKLVVQLKKFVASTEVARDGFYELLGVVTKVLGIIKTQADNEDLITAKLTATEHLMTQAQARGVLGSVPSALERARNDCSYMSTDMARVLPRGETTLWLDAQAMTINNMPMPSEEEEGSESE
ncbi:hypothetical protein KC333_g8530 [Hortaea werneckii]|nr:hypothetical protein KC333_g8530 [Hortaea werneckii]KAI7311077.1 hypothetical protein KC326_g6413 [Hortaea werneckii]